MEGSESKGGSMGDERFHCVNLPPERANRLLAAIGAIVGVINRRRMGFAKRLDRILHLILDYLGAEQGSIMLLDDNGRLVVRAATREEIVGMVQDLDEPSLAAAVVKSGEVQFVADITSDPRFPARNGGGYKSTAALSTPIRDERRVVGVINVTDKQGGTELLREDAAYLLDFSSLVLSIVVQERLTATLRRQRSTLERRNEELKRIQAQQADLTRMLVHDLKGPLSEAIANLDILSYSATEEQRPFVEAAQTACDRAVRMASNLGTIARLESGALPLIPEECDPAALVEEAVLNLAGLARSKGIEIVTALEPDLPTIQADRQLIDRVLQNLLVNALGHAPESSRVTVACRFLPADRLLEFSVADQGPGIAADLQGAIFEKYARLDRREDRLVGTGLGLYFCRLAVEAHGGEIGVDSTPGAGARFFFRLPANRSSS